jgi:hypothetical protein
LVFFLLASFPFHFFLFSLPPFDSSAQEVNNLEMLSINPLWILLSSLVAGEVDVKTASIWTDDGYIVQPICAMNCLGGTNPEFLNYLGCQKPWYNQCICNTGRASTATSWVYSCAASQCSDKALGTSAVVIYSSYCSAAGYRFQEADVAVQTSTQEAALTESNGNAVTKTSLTVVTATATVSSPSFSSTASEWLSPSQQAILLATLSRLLIFLCEYQTSK